MVSQITAVSSLNNFNPLILSATTFAIADESTLASVLGYVVILYSYSFCATASVSSGLILNFFVHSAWSSARLKSVGAFFFSFSFSTLSIRILSGSLFIKAYASSFFKNPLLSYNACEPAMLLSGVTFHSALIAQSYLLILFKIL